MKKLFVLVIMLIVAGADAQGESQITYLKLDSSIVYVDNSHGAYFTVMFPGDSIKSSGIENAYVIGDEFVQFLKRDYDRGIYTNKSKPEKEIEVLKAAMKYEVDYLEGEMFNLELEIKEEVFLNDYGKRFHLWSYKIPEMAFKDVDASAVEQRVSNYYFLNCVVNNFISGIMMVSYEGDNINEKILEIKNVANSFNIFGGPIDLDGTFAKMEAAEEDKTIEFVNETIGFEIEIPKWANIVKSDFEVFWMATMPDVNNVKNAVSLSWFEKEAYNNLEQFNNVFILDKKMGDKLNTGTFLMKKELDVADNINGIAYKIQAMFGSSLYDCQYVTFETKTHFVLAKFVATQNTYNINVEKFNDFVANIKILD